MAKDPIKVANDLIRLDLDAIRAYREAIDACTIAEIRSKLTEFMVEHERHVQDLESKVSSLGGEPIEKRDIKGFLIEGFTALTSRGDRSALLAIRVDEEVTNRLYRSALDAELPKELLEVVSKNYEDERRHLAWVKEAMRTRAWEPGKAA